MMQKTNDNTLYRLLSDWLARLIALAINLFVAVSVFTGLAGANAFTQTVLVVCLVVCLVATVVAFRRPRAGGRLMIGGAIALFAGLLVTGFFNGAPVPDLVLAFIYPVPYFVAGSMFVGESAIN
jgi:hypothetical protein